MHETEKRKKVLTQRTPSLPKTTLGGRFFFFFIIIHMLHRSKLRYVA